MIGIERELRGATPACERICSWRSVPRSSRSSALTGSRVPRLRRERRPRRPDAHRRADRHRDRLPRRGRDHPARLLRSRSHHRSHALGRGRGRPGGRRRLLQRGREHDRARADRALPAADHRLQDHRSLPARGRSPLDRAAGRNASGQRDRRDRAPRRPHLLARRDAGRGPPPARARRCPTARCEPTSNRLERCRLENIVEVHWTD